MDAGGRAASDLILQAGTPAVSEFHIPACSEGKDGLQKAQGLLGGATGGVGSEIPRPVFFRPPDQLPAGKGGRGIHANVEIGLVVTKNNVVPGAVFLDKIVLEDEGLFLRRGKDPFHLPDPGKEEGDHPPGIRSSRVVAEASPKVFCLAHIENLPGGVPHQIDAGSPGGHMDDIRQRCLRHCRRLHLRIVSSAREEDDWSALPA